MQNDTLSHQRCCCGHLLQQCTQLDVAWLQLDYVRLHGYEFHLFTSVVDPTLPKL
jgi:hypothetical protein